MCGDGDTVSIKKKMSGKHKLALELLLATVLSLLIGVLAANGVASLAYDYLNRKLTREGYYERRGEESLQSLQRFIDQNQVTEENVELLYIWVQKQRDIYAVFYKDVDSLFSPYQEQEQEEITYYDVELADGTPIKAELECYMGMKYYYGVDAASIVVGISCFVVLLLLLIHRKIRYINRLENELKILGGGNMEYPISIQGNDELTSLALGIEAMKNEILERQRLKAEAEKANTELVTAMSHDLRTPLTSLIGYLELLNLHRYDDETQLENYLKHCREKAFQMKKMSDRLFEYFLVYGKEEQPYQFRNVTCENLLEDLCNSQFFEWQEAGGSLDCQVEELGGSVKIDTEYMQRVTDNLVSNLKKYGDLDYPLTIRAFERQDMLHILLTNHVREQKNVVESTQIGLKTCRKIIENCEGKFDWERIDQEFTVHMELPLQSANSES